MIRGPLATLLLTAVLPLAPARAETACDSIRGADGLLRRGAIILLGELHGTTEAPRVVAELACEALAAGHAVAVGLELPQADQDDVDEFLAGKSSPEQLLAGAFWPRACQDGRTTAAMLDLHTRLQTLAAAIDRFEIFYIDDPSDPTGRDRAMARRVLAKRAEAPGAVIIVLTGNPHNRLQRGTPWNPDHEPMGSSSLEIFPQGRLRQSS